MQAKLKIRNWYQYGYWQIALIPHFSIYYCEVTCISFGWIFWVVEIWLGKKNSLDDLC